VTDTGQALPSVSASRQCTCLLTRLDRMSSTKALRRGAAFKVWMVNRMNKGGNGFLQTGTHTHSYTKVSAKSLLTSMQEPNDFIAAECWQIRSCRTSMSWLPCCLLTGVQQWYQSTRWSAANSKPAQQSAGYCTTS